MSENELKVLSTKIKSIFNDCLLENKSTLAGDYAHGEGIIESFSFNTEKLAYHYDELFQIIRKIIFQEEGISFYDLCSCEKGKSLIEQINIDMLIALGTACGYLEFIFPKEVWPELPSNVPFIIKTDVSVKRLKK